MTRNTQRSLTASTACQGKSSICKGNLLTYRSIPQGFQFPSVRTSPGTKRYERVSRRGLLNKTGTPCVASRLHDNTTTPQITPSNNKIPVAHTHHVSLCLHHKQRCVSLPSRPQITLSFSNLSSSFSLFLSTFL